MPLLFSAASTTSTNDLKFSERPIVEKSPVILLSKEEALQRFAFQYDENIAINENHFKKYKQHTVLTVPEMNCLEAVEDRLQHPLNDSLVVCFIDGAVGHGVFTQQPIPMGAVIALYAGQFEDASGADYAAPLALTRHEKFAQAVDNTENGAYLVTMPDGFKINAGIVGGITRFIQHMPPDRVHEFRAIEQATQAGLRSLCFMYGYKPPKQFNFDVALSGPDLELVKSGLKTFIETSLEQEENPRVLQAINDPATPIATANTTFVNLRTRAGLPIQCVVATRDIEANEQLGIFYGNNYWRVREITPRYFDKNTGQMLNPNLSTQAKPVSQGASRHANPHADSNGFKKGFFNRKVSQSTATASAPTPSIIAPSDLALAPPALGALAIATVKSVLTSPQQVFIPPTQMEDGLPNL